MSKLKFLKQTALDRLRSNIGPNQKRYAEDASFLSEYFGGSNWYVDSNIVAPESIELHIPTSKTELFDLENTTDRVFCAEASYACPGIRSAPLGVLHTRQPLGVHAQSLAG